MVHRALRGLSAAAVLVALGALVARYRSDLRDAVSRLQSVERRTVRTSAGVVEYAEAGAGPAMLVSHGILHGCDGGLRAVSDIGTEGRRVISPSRFGYLGSDMPPRADSELQADTFAELLDHLDVQQVEAIGISAGTGAALQFALRHPQRVRALIISSGNFPGSPTSEAPPDWARFSLSPLVLWTLKTVSGRAMARVMGVPSGFPRDEEQAQRVREMVESIFPVGPRHEGAVFDAFLGDPEVNRIPLEEIAVPTLVIHARDDPLASFDAARVAADRIPGSELVALDSGGHLMLGQSARVRAAVSGFLADQRTTDALS